mgnify:CR=1 FL=1
MPADLAPVSERKLTNPAHERVSATESEPTTAATTDLSQSPLFTHAGVSLNTLSVSAVRVFPWFFKTH